MGYIIGGCIRDGVRAWLSFLFNQACPFSPFWLTGCTLYNGEQWLAVSSSQHCATSQLHSRRRTVIGCLFQPHCATSQLHSTRRTVIGCFFQPHFATSQLHSMRRAMIGCLFQPHFAITQLHSTRMYFWYILLVIDSAREC